MGKAKPYNISKKVVWEAYKRVKANGGAAGVDGQTMADFEKDLKGNLYKLWNRMSSGSYFPPPVKLVEIPKGDGSKRPLGIPTIADRIAQTTVKMYLEPIVELAHNAEFLLDEARKEAITLNSAYLNLILHSCDMLAGLLGALEGKAAASLAGLAPMTRQRAELGRLGQECCGGDG